MYSYTYLDNSEIFYETHTPLHYDFKEKLFNVPLGRKFDFKSASDLFNNQETPFSQSYFGHQFGNPVILGDGRQIIIGETLLDNSPVDIAVKGSGPTRYSRGGDGLLPIDAAIKEYIYSEFLYNIHIPTTRSLALLETTEVAEREVDKTAALLIRVANSHLRVGTIQFGKVAGEPYLKEIVDYAINRHYPYLKDIDDNKKYKMFFEMVVRKQAELVAHWQSVGFVHGVMNTDNVTIDGSTIDFGPCAFLETYHQDAVFSQIDQEGRYRYQNQPKIMHWNLSKLGEAMISLFSDDEKEAVEIAQSVLDQFSKFYNRKWFTLMGEKIGIEDIDYNDENDQKMIIEFLKEIEERQLDYTNTFRQLALGTLEFTPNYRDHVVDYDLMKRKNPSFVPRHHTVEQAIEDAINGDYNKVHEMLKASTKPYNDNVPEYLKESRGNDFYTTCGT
ncbi:protein adenylyltransferase SelO family protein [Nosocomiicoccus ampullae]|uniref:protein adenylyltransferase SelO family protein n=1 Tax=Nosocomiicoccus ampullae TaxID=489910 RepID=UPI00254BF07B|nr:protein adenylyltransferase SelO family protein [Nosocomiicoccus ampullae]MDK6862995.1 protein adenylyltransferase SelO family protein [Nosocomiicoccus ampullae]